MTSATSRADASTVPAIDPAPGVLDVAVGLLDLNLDLRPGPRLGLGLTGAMAGVGFGGGLGGALRASYRLTPDGAPVHLGVLMSAGGVAGGGQYGGSTSLWVQPAVAFAWAPGDWGLALRATLGPVVGSTDSTNRITGTEVRTSTFGLIGWPLIPNAELAWRFSRHHELTLGGNALLGWRGRF